MVQRSKVIGADEASGTFCLRSARAPTAEELAAAQVWQAANDSDSSSDSDDAEPGAKMCCGSVLLHCIVCSIFGDLSRRLAALAGIALWYCRL